MAIFTINQFPLNTLPINNVSLKYLSVDLSIDTSMSSYTTINKDIICNINIDSTYTSILELLYDYFVNLNTSVSISSILEIVNHHTVEFEINSDVSALLFKAFIGIQADLATDLSLTSLVNFKYNLISRSRIDSAFDPDVKLYVDGGYKTDITYDQDPYGKIIVDDREEADKRIYFSDTSPIGTIKF